MLIEKLRIRVETADSASLPGVGCFDWPGRLCLANHHAEASRDAARPRRRVIFDCTIGEMGRLPIHMHWIQAALLRGAAKDPCSSQRQRGPRSCFAGNPPACCVFDTISQQHGCSRRRSAATPGGRGASGRAAARFRRSMLEPQRPRQDDRLLRGAALSIPVLLFAAVVVLWALLGHERSHLRVGEPDGELSSEDRWAWCIVPMGIELILGLIFTFASSQRLWREGAVLCRAAPYGHAKQILRHAMQATALASLLGGALTSHALQSSALPFGAGASLLSQWYCHLSWVAAVSFLAAGSYALVFLSYLAPLTDAQALRLW
jgi:hypothetical protein